MSIVRWSRSDFGLQSRVLVVDHGRYSIVIVPAKSNGVQNGAARVIKAFKLKATHSSKRIKRFRKNSWRFVAELNLVRVVQTLPGLPASPAHTL